MSGPKSGGYQVVDPAIVEARRRVAARESCREVYEGFRSLLRDLHARSTETEGLDVELPSLPPWPGEEAERGRYEALERELSHRHRAAQEAMAEALKQRRSAQVRASLTATESAYRPRHAENVLDDPAEAPASQEDQGDRVARLLDRIRDDLTVEEHASIDAVLATRDDAASVEAERTWITELRHVVDETNRRAARRAAQSERAMRHLADLRSHGVEAPPLVTALRAAAAGDRDLDGALKGAVAEAVAAARAREDARLVSQAMAEALEELGYVVDEGVATVLAEDGLAHVRRSDADWQDHGVRLRLDPEEGELGFHLVRAEDRDPEPELDRALEERWCEDVPDLLEALKQRGIGLELTATLEPGEVPVLAVDAGVLGGDGGRVERIDMEQGTAVNAADDRRRTRRRRRQPKARER